MKVKAQLVNTEHELKQLLDEMYALSKEGDEPFYNLIDLMLNEQTIITAIHNIKSNKGSKTAGIDGNTIDYYLNMPYKELISLVNVHLKNYSPLPIKRKNIPKANGKTRPLGIPTMIDRIIQEVVRIVIEPILEAKFYVHSYGYRPYRKASHAMAEIIDRINRSHTYFAIEGDIKGFFDNLNHNKMVEILWNLGIRDKRVLAIIKKMLKAGVIEEDKRLYPTDVGTAQGGIISPLLANAYLNNFDHLINKMYMENPYSYSKNGKLVADKRAKLGQSCKKVFLIRYADDWVILCNTKWKAQSVLRYVTKYFKAQLKLDLSEEKTLITDIRKQRAKFLGFEFFAEKSRYQDKIVGKFIPNNQKVKVKLAEVSKEIKRLRWRTKYEEDRALGIERINSKIVGIAEYYKYSNCTNFFKSWDNRLLYQTWKTVKYLNGNRGRFRKLTIKANTSGNCAARHENRRDRIFFLKIGETNMAITKFGFTHSVDAFRINHRMTPYTEEGRKIYERASNKKLPLLRNGTIYELKQLERQNLHGFANKHTYKFRLTFEYLMNREYAYLRDKGKCKCCSLELWANFESHHVNPKLPPNLINKVSNLASLCKRCHKLLHSNNDPSLQLSPAGAKKLLKYRKQYENTKKLSE